MDGGLRMSGKAARWALRFYASHVPLVLGLSMIPTVQRFYAVSRGDDLSGTANAVGETLTGAVRLLLFAAVALQMAREPDIAAIPASRRWDLLGTAMRQRLGDLAVAAVLLAAAFTVFDVLPTIAIDRWASETRRDLITAVVVAVKNPTVIAFTFLWLVGIARVLISEQRDRDDRSARTSRANP